MSEIGFTLALSTPRKLHHACWSTKLNNWYFLFLKKYGGNKHGGLVSINPVLKTRRKFILLRTKQGGYKYRILIRLKIF